MEPELIPRFLIPYCRIMTPEQQARLREFQEDYFRHGTSCAPADLQRAEAAFARAYRRIGREPVPVIWMDSPLTASLAIAALEHLSVKKNGASLKISLGDTLGASLKASFSESFGASFRHRFSPIFGFGADFLTAPDAALEVALKRGLGDELSFDFSSPPWASFKAKLSKLRRLGDSLDVGLAWELHDSRIKHQRAFWRGQQDLHWLALFKFCIEIGAEYSADAVEKLDIMHEIALSCMWWYPHDGLIIACERPLTLHFDSDERLHNNDGPAVEFRDKWKLYFVHGVRVPEWIFNDPQRLTVAAIEAEQNSEVQRVMIERFGWDRYAAECGAEILDHDEQYGTLYGRNGAALFVKVTNGSPEPDGSFRQYVLPVFPRCEPIPDEGETTRGQPQKPTALAAVASTYGMSAEEYRQLVELRT